MHVTTTDMLHTLLKVGEEKELSEKLRGDHE